MGLDMYLTARKFYSRSRNEPVTIEDGFVVEAKDLEAGYWRKHPDLHDYIVQEFADGVDNCQPIELSKDCISKIMTAITDDELPYDEKSRDLEIFNKALTWLETKEQGVWKSIIYRASW